MRVKHFIGFLCAALAACGVMRAQAADTIAALTDAVRFDKIEVSLWRRVQAGEPHELLVLFADPAIDTEMQRHMATRNLHVEDSTALSLRAARYRQLKAPALAMFSADDAEVRRDYRHLPMALMRFKNAAALSRLLARGEVLAVAEDIKLYPVLVESLSLIGQPPVTQVMGRSGAGTTIVVLDSGVDYTRSEFGACTAPGIPAGCRVVAAMDIAVNDNALDDNGHGTEVAATVAAAAPSAALAVLDVFNGNSAASSDVIAGIDWAIANKAAYNIVAINMSLGNATKYTAPCSNYFQNPFRQPIINARNAGILSVVSSGNEGFLDGLTNPACTPEAVSVGAVFDANVGGVSFGVCSDASSAADQVACFSNSASFLTLLAPGALITVTGATTAGTSFSAPFVSGAVGLLAAAFPADTPAQRLARLTSTGKPVTDARNGIIKPRLDVLAAQGPPANNALTTALTLTGGNGQVSGWNYNATAESGEPAHAGYSGGESVWWQWTAATSGTLTLDTHGSALNTLLAVYTGAAVNALTSIAGNDDDGAAGNTSGLSFHATAGVTYRIAVDGNAGATGAIVLNRSFTADPPPNADVSITLTDTPDPVTAGATLTYNIAVTNLGVLDAQNVITTLTLASNVAFVSAAGCTQSLSVVTCSLGTLTGGQQASRSVVTMPGSPGVIPAQATVSSSTADANTANNTATASTTVSGASVDVGGDVPLPPWAYVFLGAALLGCMRRRLAAQR